MDPDAGVDPAIFVSYLQVVNKFFFFYFIINQFLYFYFLNLNYFIFKFFYENL